LKERSNGSADVDEIRPKDPGRKIVRKSEENTRNFEGTEPRLGRGRLDPTKKREERSCEEIGRYLKKSEEEEEEEDDV
jgi:hypothetical protein